MKKQFTSIMKHVSAMLAGACWLAAQGLTAQAAEGAPTILFDRLVYDFGQTSQVQTVTGVFKFKNTGDGVLKVEPPKPSCGCTIAELKPDTLKPGESGELPFTLHLGQAKAVFDKRILVKSNDPKTPEVSLSIKVDYTPLYELNPLTLFPKLEFGTNAVEQLATLTRTDGKPLKITRMDTSKPWIKATLEPGGATESSTKRIRVAIQRDGSPRRFNEYVHIYSADQTNAPVSSLYVYGQLLGEVSLNPESLYWSITDAAPSGAERPEAMVLRRVAIRSADGKKIEVKNPQSTIEGIKVELVPKDAGTTYELIARLDGAPASTITGKVSFETSVAAQSRIEVPVVVHVFKP